MTEGSAKALHIEDVSHLDATLRNLAPNQAITCGLPRAGDAALTTRIAEIRRSEERLHNALLVAREKLVADIEGAVDRGEARIEQIFDEAYEPIAGSNPRQFSTSGLAIFEKWFPQTLEDVLGHPIVGASWEGFVIETAHAVLPEGAQTHFYRTSAGAEVDLVVTLPGGRRWAIEVKRSLTPKVERGFHHACLDREPERRIVVYPGSESYPMQESIQVMPLRQLGAELLKQK